MTELYLHIDNPDSASILKKLAKILDGVTIVSNKSRKCELDRSLQEIENGQTFKYDSAADFLNAMRDELQH